VGGGNRFTEYKQILSASQLRNTFGDICFLSKHTCKTGEQPLTQTAQRGQQKKRKAEISRRIFFIIFPIYDSVHHPPVLISLLLTLSTQWHGSQVGALASKHSVFQMSAEHTSQQD